MIPRASITEWRHRAPWLEDWQVEQDLVLSRAIVALFGDEVLREQLVFRGGTALHKLFFDPPGRYSEDIDLVQRHASPIGETVDRIRSVLDPWLGKPRRKAGHGRFTIYYRFETTLAPVVRARVKIEINTREHFAVHGVTTRRFECDSRWFSGAADVKTYQLSELLGTKLRALYQRKKGRDLLDLDLGLRHQELSSEDLLTAFGEYMAFGDTPVSRAEFEENMHGKMSDPTFLADVGPLLRSGVSYDAEEAWERVHRELVSRLPGDPWKLGGTA